MSHDHVVKNLELEKLSGANQVPSHLDVGFRRSWITGWVVVLWDAGAYVRWRAERLGTRPVFQA
jgi:hypothetical protein